MYVPLDNIIVPPFTILLIASLKLVALFGELPVPLPDGLTNIIILEITVTIEK